MPQIHKKFTDKQVKIFLDCYPNKKIQRQYIQKILNIKKRRFFDLRLPFSPLLFSGPPVYSMHVALPFRCSCLCLLSSDVNEIIPRDELYL